jgi:hypothetical protein
MNASISERELLSRLKRIRERMHSLGVLKLASRIHASMNFVIARGRDIVREAFSMATA